jgi:cytochrome c553
VNRPCLDCGRVIAAGSRCPVCSWKRNAAYSADRPRGRAWMKRRAAVMRRANWISEHCRNRLADEVHHLNALEDNRMESLLAVCAGCHHELEAAKIHS